MKKPRFSYTRLVKENHTAFGPEKLWEFDYSDGTLLDINLSNIDKEPAKPRYAVFVYAEKRGKGNIVAGFTIAINWTGEKLIQNAIDEVLNHTGLTPEEARTAVLQIAAKYNPEKDFGVMPETTLEDFMNRTSLMPNIVATTVLSSYPDTLTAHEYETLRKVFPEYVQTRAVANYQHNPETRKKLLGSNSRDYFYMLVGHWLTALVTALRTDKGKYNHMLKEVAGSVA